MFETNIINIHGEHGRKWLNDLPVIIENIASQYGLSGLIPLSNLSYNYVLSGAQGTRPIILKLGLDIDAIAREGAALRAFEGCGAVKLLDVRDDIMLLERIIPGHSLKSYSSPTKIKIACEVMEKLHRVEYVGYAFPDIKDWLAVLDRDWDLPHDYLNKARKLRDKLLLKQREYVLLHGDLHYDNILQHGNDWVVIDPKGVIGGPINEVWAFVNDIENDTKFIADYFNFDLQEVMDWYFVHIILAICWNLEDNIYNQEFIERAIKADRLSRSHQ